MATPVIEFRQVSVEAAGKTLLDGVSFKVRPGDKLVLCGQSGAGKSTVLKALLGLHSPCGGQIFYNGHPLTAQVLKKLRHEAAYISQEPVLAADTVREALLLPFRFKAHRRRPPADSALTAAMASLGLPESLLAQATCGLSGGEKQRLALARGLLLGKSLFLLDEVTSALDAHSRQAVYAACFKPELTVLSVSHDPDWLARCNLAITLTNGRLEDGRCKPTN